MNWKQQIEDFKSALIVEPLMISATNIRFGFFGLVGGGKSVTGGIFALGITPAPGTIGWVDGEGHRSGWAADLVAEKAAAHYGGTKADHLARFRVVHIDPPFHPLRAVAAAEVLISQGCKTVILDLLSQCWDSDGGYLDLKNDALDGMAGDDLKKRERSAAAAAARVKPWTHQKLVNFVTVAPANVVLIFQGKAKFNARTSKPDEVETPIQESGMTRTALAVGRVEARAGEGGFCTFAGDGTKYTHPGLRPMLPENRQLTFKDAEIIAAWARAGQPVKQSGAALPAQAPSAASPISETKALLGQLRELTTNIHHWHKGDTADDWAARKPKLEQWLWDESVLHTDKRLADLSAAELVRVIEVAARKLKPT